MNNEFNQTLIDLVKENPELPIMPATHHEVVCSDEHNYWLGEIEKVVVDYFYLAEEFWYVGKENIMEYLSKECNNSTKKLISKDDFDLAMDIKFDELLESGEIKKAIIIYIGV